jgi:hypothetical protein
MRGMVTRIALAVAAVLVVAATARAHHSYAAFDREHPVTVEGDIERMIFANPHVTFTLHSRETTYSVEWGNLNQMNRANVTSTTLAPGDHVIVTGSITFDRTDHRLSIVKAITRPSDGWSWATPASR